MTDTRGAIIPGATDGIGKATARRTLANGWEVATRRSRDTCEATIGGVRGVVGAGRRRRWSARAGGASSRDPIMTTTIDARGELCPRPLILTRQGLKDVPEGARVRVLVDNETSRRNVERYLSDHGATVTVTRDGADFTLEFDAPRIDAPPALSPAPTPATTTAPSPAAPGWVVALAGDTIGRGSAELGAKLAAGFLPTLLHVEPRPSHVVLYSSGVLLAIDGTPTAAALAALQQAGVEILLCGMCVDYYERRADIRVGTITDMLRILGILASAAKIFSP